MLGPVTVVDQELMNNTCHCPEYGNRPAASVISCGACLLAWTKYTHSCMVKVGSCCPPGLG